ncbi:helix-turn-helix transcriptional regulator [Pseudomonas alloputida]|uniref:helix-turn-helix transcriptional regulator n=1 Tax=Pseudomonas alloputida TaxID=1940621 RepID=UPI0038642405
MMDAKAYAPMRVLRLRQVQERIGLSRSTIYDRMNVDSPRYDSTFPRPMKIGCSAVGWLEESVNDWIRSKMDGADGGKTE